MKEVQNIIFPNVDQDDILLVNNAANIGEIVPIHLKNSSTIIKDYNLNIITPTLLCSRIINLYLKNQKQDIKQTIKEIKMYHSNLNYCGYGLKCQNNEIPNSCVPSYILKLYNNKDETNPIMVITKLTMNILLKEIEMKQ